MPTLFAHIGIMSATILLFAAAPVISADSATQKWILFYNGPGNGVDEANAIAVDAFGNVFVTGSSEGSGTGFDYATVCYNPSGVQMWAARYNGPGNDSDWSTNLTLDSFGNVYVTGYSKGAVDIDYATISYDGDGGCRWESRYDGNSTEYACDMGLDALGNVYVTGSGFSKAGEDYVTLKYDPLGALQWVTRYMSGEFGYAIACALAVDEAGNCFVLGDQQITYGGYIGNEFVAVAYDPSGNLQWVAGYGSGLSSDPADIALCGSDGILVVGKVDGEAPESMRTNYGTVMYDYSGEEQWNSEYNGTANMYDSASAVAVDAAGNSYITGYSAGVGTGTDYTTVKYDSTGNMIWVMRFSGPSEEDDEASAIATDIYGNVFVTGKSFSQGTGFDFATIMYGQTTGI